MRKIILTQGLPASGKSTWAREYQKKNPNTVLVNKDELRAMLHQGIHSKGREAMVLNIRDSIIMKALAERQDVIVHDTNLHYKHIDQIRKIAEMLPWKGTCEVIIQDFTDIPLEECIRRDQNRPNYVGEKVIRTMYNQYLKPKTEAIAALKWDENLPSTIICDLDGTLCLLNGRNPYDASTCENDLVNPAMYGILSAMQYKFENTMPEGKIKIMFCSGREDKYRDQTIGWLRNNGMLEDSFKLYMRKTGDNRKDSIIKKEIYEEHIKGKYNVLFVLDDRNQVVDLWRSLGLTCLQVAPGDF